MPGPDGAMKPIEPLKCDEEALARWKKAEDDLALAILGFNPRPPETPSIPPPVVSKKISVNAYAMLALAHGSGILNVPDTKEPRVKKCLICEIHHDHNNAFCSAKCCREYTRRKKEGNEHGNT